MTCHSPDHKRQTKLQKMKPDLRCPLPKMPAPCIIVHIQENARLEAESYEIRF
jgi:hypothetical protein